MASVRGVETRAKVNCRYATELLTVSTRALSVKYFLLHDSRVLSILIPVT